MCLELVASADACKMPHSYSLCYTKILRYLPEDSSRPCGACGIWPCILISSISTTYSSRDYLGCQYLLHWCEGQVTPSLDNSVVNPRLDDTSTTSFEAFRLLFFIPFLFIGSLLKVRYRRKTGLMCERMYLGCGLKPRHTPKHDALVRYSLGATSNADELLGSSCLGNCSRRGVGGNRKEACLNNSLHSQTPCKLIS